MDVDFRIPRYGALPSAGFSEADLDAYTLAVNGFWLKGPVGKVETSPPEVDSWTPLNSAAYGMWEQTLAGQKPVSSSVDGRGCVLFDGTGGFGAGSYMYTLTPAALWNFLHQTGFSFATVVRRTAGAGVVIWDNCSNNINQRGTSLIYNSGNGDMVWSVMNGSGVAMVQPILAGVYPVGTKAIFDGSWSPASGYSFAMNGGPAMTGAIVGAPSMAAATGPLYLGAGYPGSFGFNFGDEIDIWMQPGVWTGQARSNVLSVLGALNHIPLADGWPAGRVVSSQPLFLI